MLQTKCSGMQRRVCRRRTERGVRRGLGRVTCASSAAGKAREDGSVNGALLGCWDSGLRTSPLLSLPMHSICFILF